MSTGKWIDHTYYRKITRRTSVAFDTKTEERFQYLKQHFKIAQTEIIRKAIKVLYEQVVQNTETKEL